jgi:anti-sigma factor RsiW
MSPSFETDRCADIQQDLEAYLDGGLSTIRVHEIEGHLSDCQACLTQMHLAKEIQNELRALPELDAPAPVIQSIYDQTVRAEEPGRSLTGWLGRWSQPVWATLAAASLVLVLGLALLNRGTSAPDQPDQATIAQATAEARFALAQVGFATRKAGLAVRDKALRDQIVLPTQRSLAESLGRDPENSSGSLDEGVDDV